MSKFSLDELGNYMCIGASNSNTAVCASAMPVKDGFNPHIYPIFGTGDPNLSQPYKVMPPNNNETNSKYCYCIDNHCNYLICTWFPEQEIDINIDIQIN